METIDFKALLKLKRTISVFDTNGLSESQIAIVEKVKDFGIDEIYFSTDEKTSYPAVFLKKVKCFDIPTLKIITSIQQKTWNYQKVLFLYVYNDTEIRIYNCSERPFVVTKKTDFEKELEKLEVSRVEASDKLAINKLIIIFSSIAIDSGILWTLPEALDIKKKINLQRRVDKYLVDSLVCTTNKLKEMGLSDVELVHKIILRSLFLLYLEDRHATDNQFYNSIKKGAQSYFDILDDVECTYKLFAALEYHFNGNVFSVSKEERLLIKKEHLLLIRKCFINGYDEDGQIDLFQDWRLFNFKIIQIELLSEIYERFLEESNLTSKKKSGAFYTPPSLVELILNEKLPIEKKQTNYNVKILDPACGSGIFLVESYKRLVKRYENQTGEKLTDFEKLTDLLVQNIFGIEIDDQAIVVAAFSLYLALLDKLDPKTLWQSKRLPYLINNPKKIPSNKQGNNLFCRDSINTNNEIESISFDLVIGNPPFGTENKSKGVELLSTIRKYCEKENFAKEMVLPFLHKAVKFAPNGEIALIFNTKILTNTGSTYQNFREWLFNKCYVERIYNFSILRNAPKGFGGQLFDSAIGPICIVFYRKEEPEQKSDRITYYAPKTFVKSNILEGVVIDSIDVKYLPRRECQTPDSKIWKIAMWGGERDFFLIKRLETIHNNLGKYIKKGNIEHGVGLQPLNKSTRKPIIDNDLSKMKFIRPENILRYYSSSNQSGSIKYMLKDKETINEYLRYYNVKSIDEIDTFNVFRRIGAKKVYAGPMLLVKEGLSDKRICASVIDSPTAYNSSVLGFLSDMKDLRLLSSLINSKLATYYLLMISSSWGMERERIKPNEVYSFPIAVDEEAIAQLNYIHKQIEQLNELESDKIMVFEKEIDKIIEEQYKLSNKEISIVDDFINFSADLLYEKERSKALLPSKNTEDYAKVLCSELNIFLEDQNLYANGTVYLVNKNLPILLVKISFGNKKQEIKKSVIEISKELEKIDKYLWEEKGGSIYFRKKVNYYDGDDIYIIRPNQRRFWTKTRAMEDASELILEILNKD